jgi:hypothetical protein
VSLRKFSRAQEEILDERWDALTRRRSWSVSGITRWQRICSLSPLNIRTSVLKRKGRWIMKPRTVIGVALVAGYLAFGTVGINGGEIRVPHRSGFVNLTNPTEVDGVILDEGQYLIVHDEVKMASGQACTTIYCLDPQRGWRGVVSFHCNPVQRSIVDRPTLTIVPGGIARHENGVRKFDRLVEYQLAGESEGHGVPGR